jgi:hypothetical protein
MKILVVVAAFFASASLVTPTVLQGQTGGDAKAVSSDAKGLIA